MSIFAEYKHGLISEDEFKAAAAREFAGDNDYEPAYEDEDEPITETATANWHTNPPTCGGEFFVTLAYDFEAGGKNFKGRYIDIAEYDYCAREWIFENPNSYILKKGAQVVAWAVLPNPYNGEVKGACK
jgi:hypothetical protein